LAVVNNSSFKLLIFKGIHMILRNMLNQNQAIPQEMNALILRQYSGIESLSFEKIATQLPKSNEVVVKLDFAAVNPSDVMFCKGQYGFRKTAPCIPGFEGSGTVVAAGGPIGKALLGKRVSCTAPRSGGGTWAEYLTTPVTQCYPLRKSLSSEQGAMLFVNPLTAYALLDIAKKSGHKAILHTAGGSALGKIMCSLSQSFGVKVVPVVRREEQREELMRLGAGEVLLVKLPEDWQAHREYLKREDICLAFDAVSGPGTGELFNALPSGGKVISYGALSEAAVSGLDPKGFIFQKKSMSGFALDQWLLNGNLMNGATALWRLQALLKKHPIQIEETVALENAAQAIMQREQTPGQGKILIKVRL
jgi:NADPH:quinone reductase